MPAHRLVLTITTLALVLPAAASSAGPPKEHFDIWLQPIDGRVVTGSISEGTPGEPIDSVQRVFGAELGEDADFPFSTDEPGFQALAGPLTAGMSWSFNIVGTLGVWNGGGFDDAAETMLIEFGPASAESGDGFVSGFAFSGFADGLLHDHFDFTLLASGQVAGTGPADGIYLLTLEFLGVNGPISYAASDPTFLVFNLNSTEEQHEAAISWVQENLAPAPGGLALLGVALLRRSRRRAQSLSAT